MSLEGVKELQDVLAAAVRTSLGLPPAERAAFIGRHLLAVHEGAEPPSLPNALKVPPPSPSLKDELQALSTTITAAVNQARGGDGWPLAAVAHHLTMPPAAANPAAESVASIASACSTTPPSAAPAAALAGASLNASAEAKREEPARPKPRGGYGALGGAHSRVEKQATFRELEEQRAKSRPQTLGAAALQKLEMEQIEEAPQSARAAVTSWSLTGGAREASFRKKRPVVMDDDSGSFVKSASRPPSSVGFATVLSLSGWSDVDASELFMAGPAGGSEPIQVNS